MKTFFQPRLFFCLLGAFFLFATSEKALAADAVGQERVYILEIKCRDGFVTGMDSIDPDGLCLEIEEKIAAAMNSAGFGTFLAKDLANDTTSEKQPQPESSASPVSPVPAPSAPDKQPEKALPPTATDEHKLPVVQTEPAKATPNTADDALETSVAPEKNERGVVGWLAEITPSAGQPKDKKADTPSKPGPDSDLDSANDNGKTDEKPALPESADTTPDNAKNGDTDKDASPLAASLTVTGEVISLTAGPVETKLIAGRERKSADMEIIASFDIRDENNASLFSETLKGLARKDTPLTSDTLESPAGKKELASQTARILANALVSKLKGSASPSSQQPTNDRQRYQDSPGKTLKPRKQKTPNPKNG